MVGAESGGHKSGSVWLLGSAMTALGEPEELSPAADRGPGAFRDVFFGLTSLVFGIAPAGFVRELSLPEANDPEGVAPDPARPGRLPLPLPGAGTGGPVGAALLLLPGVPEARGPESVSPVRGW